MTYEFKRIGLWGRFNDSKVAEPALLVTSHLRERGIEVIAPAGVADALESVTHADLDTFAATLDMLVAIGGDGNLLRAARCVADHSVPLVGINRGRLGFLTDISPEHMLAALDNIIDGHFHAERRTLLSASIKGSGEPPMLALNDVVVQKGDSGRILDFTTSVDGTYVNTHGGDGLIVATPTGSTAYALSCNGPIIRPDVDALVLVPICPHTLSDRPLVVPSSSVIEVQIPADSEGTAYVTCDGEDLGALTGQQTLEIKAAAESITLLHPTEYNYYELLRSKLNWGRTNRVGN
jgi:NAD+ kinase